MDTRERHAGMIGRHEYTRPRFRFIVDRAAIRRHDAERAPGTHDIDVRPNPAEYAPPVQQ